MASNILDSIEDVEDIMDLNNVKIAGYTTKDKKAGTKGNVLLKKKQDFTIINNMFFAYTEANKYANTAEKRMELVGKIVSLHDEEKYGDINNFCYNVFFNVLTMSKDYQPSHLDDFKHLSYRDDNLVESMYEYILVFVTLFENNVNKACDMIMIVLDKLFVQELQEEKCKYAVDKEKLSEAIANLSETEKRHIQNLSPMMVYNVFVSNYTKKQDFLHSYKIMHNKWEVYEIYEFLRDRL